MPGECCMAKALLCSVTAALLVGLPPPPTSGPAGANPPMPAHVARRMDEVCGQSKLFAREGESVRLPVAHMVCNQTPPVGGKPSLMTFRWVALIRACANACWADHRHHLHSRQSMAEVAMQGCGSVMCHSMDRSSCRAHTVGSSSLTLPPWLLLTLVHLVPMTLLCSEVETLFHEFGHAAQHMLTEQKVRTDSSCMAASVKVDPQCAQAAWPAHVLHPRDVSFSC